MSRIWINLNRNGRFGNRMFSRAHIYAAAREFGAVVCDYGMSDVAEHFPVFDGRRIPTYPIALQGSPPPIPAHPLLSQLALRAMFAIRPKRTGALGPLWSCYWGKGNPEDMALNSPSFARFVERHDVVLLDGYKLRCVDWVRKHQEEIRACFSLRAEVLERARGKLEASRGRATLLLGVHMRQTDFATAMGGKAFLSVTDYGRILRDKVLPTLPSVRCIVFSDRDFGQAGAAQDLSTAFTGIDFSFLHGSAVEDLAGLMTCDAIVGPMVSTYSRWAAFAARRPWYGVNAARLASPDPVIQPVTDLVPWDY
jgi:hypothetical protein